MQNLSVDEERLHYLANRVTELTTHRTNFRELGDIALEVMMARLKIEELLDTKPKKDQRAHLNRTLRELKEVEKSIVRMYVLQSLEQQHAVNPFLSYVRKRQLWENVR